MRHDPRSATPFSGASRFNSPCLTWPAAPQKPVEVDGAKAPAILLVDETLDAATPYEGSLVVRSLFPDSRLISLPGGTSHAVTLFGNPCTDNAIADYFASGVLPARRPGRTSDKQCAPLPEPTPGAALTAAVPGSAAPRMPGRLLS